MATIGQDSYPVEFNFAGSPVVLVLSGVLSGFPSNCIFKQMEISVTAGVQQTGLQRTYVFLVDVDGDTLRVDIASALRSALFETDYSPDWLMKSSISYPWVEFSVTYRERYLVDGEVYYGSATTINTGSVAVQGRISEMERMRVSAHVADWYEKLRFTSKPISEPEVVAVGDTVMTTTFTSLNKVVSVPKVIETPGKTVLSDGRTVYALANDGSMHSILFVNSLGVLDTATAVCSENLSYDITSEFFPLVGEPSNLKVAGMASSKSAPNAVLGMSSGFVSRRWADWWAEEVLQAGRCWVKYGKRYQVSGGSVTEKEFWVPCVISPKEDSTVVYDRNDTALCAVQFRIQLAGDGSAIRSLLDA